MAFASTVIRLSAEERSALEKNLRAARTEQRLAFRSHIILLAAGGMGTNAIAAQLQTYPATVSKWRVRFSRIGLPGLTERAQGYLHFRDGQTFRGFSDRYKRHGATTLFAALEVATGLVTTGHYKRRRIELLDFMNKLVRQYPEDQEIHVILDNLSTHSKKGGTWLARHPSVHFHFTPTNASWLNQIEVWFSILTVRVLRNGSFTSTKELRGAIERFTAAYCEDCGPFAWTKEKVHQVTLKRCHADLCK